MHAHPQQPHHVHVYRILESTLLGVHSVKPGSFNKSGSLFIAAATSASILLDNCAIRSWALTIGAAIQISAVVTTAHPGRDPIAS